MQVIALFECSWGLEVKDYVITGAKREERSVNEAHVLVLGDPDICDGYGDDVHVVVELFVMKRRSALCLNLVVPDGSGIATKCWQ